MPTTLSIIAGLNLSSSQNELDFERKRRWLQKTDFMVAISLSSRVHLRRNLWQVKGLQSSCWQAKRAADELAQPGPSAREEPGTSSGIRNEFQSDQHETHQMVPIVKQQVAQQGAQVVEEVLADHQVLAQHFVLLIQ